MNTKSLARECLHLLEIIYLCFVFQETNCLVDENVDSVNICRLSASNVSVKICTHDEGLDVALDVLELNGDDIRPYSKASFKR